MVDELIKLFPKSLEGWIKPSKAVDESHYLALTKSKHGWPVRPVYFQRSSHTAELYPCGFDSMDDIELCAEYHDVEHLLTNAGGMKKLAYKLTKENTKLKTSLKEAEERIKELEVMNEWNTRTSDPQIESLTAQLREAEETVALLRGVIRKHQEVCPGFGEAPDKGIVKVTIEEFLTKD